MSPNRKVENAQKEITVRILVMSSRVWDKVVVRAKEKMVVVSESSDDFVVEYTTVEDYKAAVSRFDGIIPFELVV